MDTEHTPLLPCPFCGGEGDIREYTTAEMAWVKCLGCGVEYPPSETEVQTGEMAAAEWNRRALVPELVSVLSEARDKFYETSDWPGNMREFLATIDALLAKATS